ncbi:hypothetical protein [Actinokineospora pegani]|uniref:hypothetical protein n=1 Tax=Actinokineospora pegani TaxID=2654637 RepID=UPI0012EA3F41|nr:hypothetical protein [Actinokineospora pegani]
MLKHLSDYWALARAMIRALLRDTTDDRGYATETVVVTALLVAAALAVVAIIIGKVMEKANGITF